MRELIFNHQHPDQAIGNAPHPCDTCPWRLANQGKADDPHEFYTRENLDRLWFGLRGGERMTCHPTDKRMAEFEGYEHTADLEKIGECTGSMILLQREVWRFYAICKEMDAKPRDPERIGIDVYQERYPTGLTFNGMVANVERLAFRSPKYVAPNLNEEGIGYEPLGEWSPPS